MVQMRSHDSQRSELPHGHSRRQRRDPNDRRFPEIREIDGEGGSKRRNATHCWCTATNRKPYFDRTRFASWMHSIRVCSPACFYMSDTILSSQAKRATSSWVTGYYSSASSTTAFSSSLACSNSSDAGSAPASLTLLDRPLLLLLDAPVGVCVALRGVLRFAGSLFTLPFPFFTPTGSGFLLLFSPEAFGLPRPLPAPALAVTAARRLRS